MSEIVASGLPSLRWTQADLNSTVDPTWRAFRRRRRTNIAGRLAETTEKSQNSRSAVFFGSPLSATRSISDSADVSSARFWSTTWRQSRDRKGYWFPRELRHSAALDS